MGSSFSRLVSRLMLPLIVAASLAMAAGPDLRLVNAAAGQDTDTVRALLTEGVDVNVARADGVTALLWASHWDDLETVDMLLRAGANVDAAEDHGVTALARACENAHAAMVEMLLTAGADPNVAQASGLTPLMIAAQTGIRAGGESTPRREGGRQCCNRRNPLHRADVGCGGVTHGDRAGAD